MYVYEAPAFGGSLFGFEGKAERGPPIDKIKKQPWDCKDL